MSQDRRRQGWILLGAVFASSVAHAGAGGTEGSDSTLLLYLIFLPLILGYSAYVAILKFYAKRAAATVLAQAAARDSIWDPKHLIQHTRTVFIQIQNIWSRNDQEAAYPFLHPDYRDEFSALMTNNIQSGIVNLVTNIRLTSVDLVIAKDYADNDQDMFVAHISGTMDDVLQDERGTLVKTQGDQKGDVERNIDEYWRFQRSGDEWLLRQISQDDDILNDEVSIDAETLATKHPSTADLDVAIRHIEEQEQRTQLGYRRVAQGVGLTVVFLGYYLYFLFFRGAWRMLEEMFF